MYRTYALPVLVATLSLPLSFSTKAQSAPTEITGTWRGQVEALVVDNPQAGTARTRLFLHTADENFELHGTEGTALRSGQTAEVAGQATRQHLAVSRVTTSAATPAANACSATGDQKAAVILVSFPSKALLSSVTPALVGASFFGSGRTVDTFLRESSFGQTWITGEVLGPYVLDADYFDEPLAIRDAALRAAAPFADLTQYNRFFVVAPQGQSGMDSGGMALLGCGQISSPQGDLNASSMWMGAESMVGQNEIVDIATHELGHGFGLEHARFADYGSDVLGPAGQAGAPWDAIHEYGDNDSNMGRNSAQWAASAESDPWVAATQYQYQDGHRRRKLYAIPIRARRQQPGTPREAAAPALATGCGWNTASRRGPSIPHCPRRRSPGLWCTMKILPWPRHCRAWTRRCIPTW